MKKVLVISAMLLIAFSAKSQLMHNLEIGGVNYTGISLTTEYRFNLYDDDAAPAQKFHISPKVGLGHVFWWDLALTFQGGLAVGMENRWGHIMELNTNFAYLHNSPFGEQVYYNDYGFVPSTTTIARNNFGSVLWYSGFDYRFEGKVNYTMGLGALTLIERFKYSDQNVYLSDFTPMLKLGIGFSEFFLTTFSQRQASAMASSRSFSACQPNCWLALVVSA